MDQENVHLFSFVDDGSKIFSPKSLTSQPPILSIFETLPIDKATKIKFLKEHKGTKAVVEGVDQKIDFLFEVTLHDKLTELLKNRETMGVGIASLIISKKGTLYRTLIPSILKWLQIQPREDLAWLSFRLRTLAANSCLLNQFQERWKITHAEKIDPRLKNSTEAEIKKMAFATLLSHPRQTKREDCFAFAVAWSIFYNKPENLVRDLRILFSEGGLLRKTTDGEYFFPILPISDDETLFDLWSALLASMAESGKKGAITSAVIAAILYQVSKFVNNEETRELLPKVQKALMQRIYMGYDTHAFEGTGSFILHDAKNHFLRVDNAEKFVDFLVLSTRKWLGETLKDRQIVRDLLATFHPDHNNLRVSLGGADLSRHTPWACDSGNDPGKILATYFEEKAGVHSSKLNILNCRALYDEIQTYLAQLSSSTGDLRLPIRVVGKHTFTLVIPPIQEESLYIFADTNWEQEGQDLFLAFVLDKEGQPTQLVKTTRDGSIKIKLEETEWFGRKWEFYF